jgi:KDO2-lipid IV(A) lauroyltransferase
VRAHEVLTQYGAKGIVVATAHTGNWDLVACASAKRLPLAVVTKRLSVAWLDRFWQKERAAWGIELLHGEGAFRAAARAIASRRSVALLVDQAPERKAATLRTSFMGETAYCDLMPALLAARTGAPLVLALGRRESDGTHTIDVPLVLEPPPRPSRAWVEAATQSINAALERFVRADPAQWLWLHRRWKPLPAAPGRAERGLLSLST